MLVLSPPPDRHILPAVGPSIKLSMQNDAEENEAAKAIVSRLRRQAHGIGGSTSDGSAAYPEHAQGQSISLTTTMIQALQQTITKHLKHETRIPASQLSKELDMTHHLLNILHILRSSDYQPEELKTLQSALYSLIFDLERLINPKRTCTICTSTKNASQFPEEKATTDCEHDSTTCRACLESWLRTQIVDQGTLRVRCIECTSEFRYEDVRRFAEEGTFER